MAASSTAFMYFGYGSNLLRERILLQNPSVVFVTSAKLDNYKLEFDYPSKSWHGAAATVTRCLGDHVWGVVWKLDRSDLTHLDDQEGVSTGIYEPIQVDVISEDQKVYSGCRSYQLLKRGFDDRRPSPHYLEVIVRGAIQHKLPDYYINKLKNIQHNNYSGPPPPVFNRLGLSGHHVIIK